MKNSTGFVELLAVLTFSLLSAILPLSAFAQFQQSWVRTLDTPNGASAITLDGQGNLCVAGTSAGNFLTAQYSADGTQL